MHYLVVGLTCPVFAGLRRKSRARAELDVEGLLGNRARRLFNLCLRHQSPRPGSHWYDESRTHEINWTVFPSCGAHQPGWAGDGYHLREWETLPCQVCGRIAQISVIRKCAHKGLPRCNAATGGDIKTDATDQIATSYNRCSRSVMI